MSTAAPSYVRGPVDVPLLEETIGQSLRRTARRVPEREALVDCAHDARLTYAELDAAVDRLASGLLAAGIEAGDRVGLWAPNGVEWFLTQYATARIGAILVNLNPAYREHELEYALEHSGARMLVAAREFRGTDLVAIIARIRARLPRLDAVALLDGPVWRALAEAAPDPDALEARAATLAATDAVDIQYTSGTTGAPKGVTLSHRNVLNNGFSVGELLGYDEHDRVCVPVPFYHCFGMVMGNLAATAHGACVVIPAPAFDAAATLRAVAAERCTSLYGVPTMFIAMLEHPSFPGHDLTSLRTGIMAGSPCPEAIMRQVVERMHMSEVSICYGMTETSPVSTQTRRDDPQERRVSTVGRVGPHVEVQVVDPASGAVVPRGETGELCTRGYSVMLGYWPLDHAPGDAERTAEPIDVDGWMHTGDLATIDADGYVRIVGRSKDMVIRGGENVSPREIEELLYTHPEVADVQVVGVPDARYGEELCAWIRLRDGAVATETEVRSFCRERAARFKVPRYVLFVEDFPMTVTGKVQKFRMRETSIQRLGLGAEREVVA